MWLILFVQADGTTVLFSDSAMVWLLLVRDILFLPDVESNNYELHLV